MTLTEIINAAQRAGSTHKQSLGVYQFFEGELCAFVDAVQADDKELIEALKLDVDYFEDASAAVRAENRRLRAVEDAAKAVIEWCEKNPPAGDALWCVARLREALS
jgi:hypothetical protein